MQSVQIVVPQFVQVFNIFCWGKVHYAQTKFFRQFALANSHFPISFRFFFVYPLQTYMTVFLSLYYVGT
mgnify:CR=1 FL=1